MKVLIVTEFNEFIDALNINTDLNQWAYNWLMESGRNIDIDYHENGSISYDQNSICISADNGIINLDIKIKNI